MKRFLQLLVLSMELSACGKTSTAPAAVATQIVFGAQPSSATAGASIAPSITAIVNDATGNTVTSFSGAVTLGFGSNPGGAILGGTTTASAVAGVATFNNVAINKAGSGYTLIATSGALMSAQSSPFSISAGAAATLTRSGGDSQSGFASVELPVRLSVTVTDAFGNPASGAVVNWAVASGAGSLGAPASSTNALGVASISWTLGASAGAQSVIAAVAGVVGSATFTATATPFTFASLSAGAYFTCGLAASGAAYCWGWNADGELGDSTKSFRWTPVAVQGGLHFAGLSGGLYHTCGVAAGGTGYCWGDNGSGQSTLSGAVGDGTIVQRLSPTAVAGGFTFASISAGGVHSCGMTTNGKAYCWGANNLGELGDGTTITQQLSPTPVAGNLVFTSVVAGASQGCGLVAGGAAYCWGVNGYGEVGDGTTTTRTSPVPVSGGFAFAKLSAGFRTCGLTAAGAAVCWGENSFGGIGDGTSSTVHSTPTPVAGGLVFQNISPGGSHTCGLAVGGIAYCWGLNQYGELGDGTTTQRLTPTLVAGGLTFAEITSGKDHSCGRTTAGVVYCWGRNSYGEIGDGTIVNRLVPTAVIP